MIGIIDYDMGNIQSVVNAMEHLSFDCKIVREREDLEKVDKIILPGVGAFGEGIEKLKQRDLLETLNREVIAKKKHFLGICLGMQLICKESFEFGHFLGLSWIEFSVKKLEPSREHRVPHMGWNNLIIKRQNSLIRNDGQNNYLDVYFVHSYYVDAKDSDMVVATCEYDIEIPAAIEKDNIFAVQFHPEKSQRVGLKILENFARL
jgi:glutamine amidotransferase